MTERSVDNDTIAAVATAPGRGGIGVVRISGPRAFDIAHGLTKQRPRAGRAQLMSATDGDQNRIDQGVVLYFEGPASFTGEDVVEFQGHGSDTALAMVLERVVQLGARLARPGEFSERSFLNGKIDLTQAEAIIDLVNSASKQAVLGAARSMSGELSRLVNALDGEILRLRLNVEGAIDFPDEDVDFLVESDFINWAERLVDNVEAIIERTRVGALLNNGLTVALAGRPNVGKSSLLNRLSNEDRAIVTDVPGTTRDTLNVDFDIEGMPVRMVDTAGVRQTEDTVELAGVERAKAAVETADVVLWIVDHIDSNGDWSSWSETWSKELSKEWSKELSIDRSEKNVIVVKNKVDLEPDGERSFGYDNQTGLVRISALTGEGLEDLRAAIKDCVGFQSGEGAFTARQRHVDALRRTRAALLAAQEAGTADNSLVELIAEELRFAHNALGGIVGTISADDLLGEIFANFCIGK